ncbi:MAG: S8 family serine peptidase [Desulfobacterales bacterium]
MKRMPVTVVFILAVLLGISPAVNADPPEHAGYIVVLNDSVRSPADAAKEIVGQAGGRVGFIYEHALKGFSITVPPQAVAALEKNPNVKYVVTDEVRYAFAQTVPTGVQRIFADTNTNIDIDGTDDYRVDVGVAVIDTGVDFEHPDLNVAGGVDCTCSGGGPPWARKYYCSSTEGTGGDDDHYHGTHVAGTIAAIDNGIGVVGVAPGARLWAVKVLDSSGSGYSSGIVAGIDWVAANAGVIEVANMSLGGGGFNQAEYDAIQGAVNKGVAFAVAAGNSDDDAANYSPAAFDNVLTVSALADFDGAPGGSGSPTCRDDQDDTLADFSNWGSAVDIAAPGVCILSTFPIEQGEYGTISGTSMASPHAAGALALLASADNPSDAADVYNLYDQVINAGNSDWVDDSGDGIKEPLLDVNTFNPEFVAIGGDENAAPTAHITEPANGDSFDSNATISFSGSASDNEDGDLTAGLDWASDKEGQIGTGGSFSAVLSDGTHTITAEVTDSAGNTASDSITIAVGGGSDGGITLTATGYKFRGLQKADLEWSGATHTSVDIYRNDVLITTIDNNGSYTDNIDLRGGGSYIYKVCDSEGCSNEVTVIFY